MALIPYNQEYTNSPYDIRQRVTLNGNYQLPFGRGQRFLNNSGWTDELVGGWSTSLTFAAQTGTPFPVSPSISTANGGSARAILVRDPFREGRNTRHGQQPQSDVSAQLEVRTKANWYNPCSFANPLAGNLITGSNIVTNQQQAIAYLGGRSNQVYGPGYNAVNMSLFKNFTTFREQFLQFRADAFNLLNHPTWANPSNQGIGHKADRSQAKSFFRTTRRTRDSCNCL